MKKITTITVSALFYIFLANATFAQDYKTIKDISFDGKDAIGKKAALCVRISNIYERDVAVWDEEGSTSMSIIKDPKKKELLKKILTTSAPGNKCTEIIVKIIPGFYGPTGELISVGETRDRRER